MNNKLYGTVCIFILAAVCFVSAGSLNAQKQADTKVLAGKIVWIVDVNTTEKYISAFQVALLPQLQQLSPGIILKHVITSEKGNPFFMLKKANYPDVVIISLGVCEATAKRVANYASEARKRGIPSVICYDDEIRDIQQEMNNDYRNAKQPAIAIHGMPERPEEAVPVVKKAAPSLIGKLIEFFKV